jgi:dTDP-4-dehydrorhamnose 3,5-epimerase
MHAGTVRGLHFQCPPQAQAKLIRVIAGRILDVAVDIRSGSPTYGRHVSAELSAQNGLQLFVPIGYAHGFVTLEPDTEVIYKVSDFYDAGAEGGIRWNDAQLAIGWGIAESEATISDKDAALPEFTGFRSPFVYDGVPMALVTVG